MIRAYLVPPYGITWERRRRKKIFKILVKDLHHDREIMSKHDADDKFYWK